MKVNEIPYADPHINRIIMEVKETEERFIFTKIYPFLRETMEVEFDKQTLIDALIEFKANHPERFEKGAKNESSN